jgi:hypothetical protein
MVAQLRELSLSEPHADRLLIEVNPAEGDLDERKNHATRSRGLANDARMRHIYPREPLGRNLPVTNAAAIRSRRSPDIPQTL